ANEVVLVRAGKEESVAATKTYTGQLLALYLIAWALGGAFKIDDLRRLPQHAAAALTLAPRIASSAIRYRFMDHAVVVARGLNYANAFEFALKLMETCYVIAERFSSADFLHGPIAMVERAFPVFVFAPAGVTWQSIGGIVDKVHALRAETVIVTDAANPEAAGRGTRIIKVPRKLKELYTPIPYVI